MVLRRTRLQAQAPGPPRRAAQRRPAHPSRRPLRSWREFVMGMSFIFLLFFFKWASQKHK